MMVSKTFKDVRQPWPYTSNFSGKMVVMLSLKKVLFYLSYIWYHNLKNMYSALF